MRGGGLKEPALCVDGWRLSVFVGVCLHMCDCRRPARSQRTGFQHVAAGRARGVARAVR